jgi:hypothetical protein
MVGGDVSGALFAAGVKASARLRNRADTEPDPTTVEVTSRVAATVRVRTRRVSPWRGVQLLFMALLPFKQLGAEAVAEYRSEVARSVRHGAERGEPPSEGWHASSVKPKIVNSVFITTGA